MSTATLRAAEWAFTRSGGQDRPEILDREDIDPEPVSTDGCEEYHEDVCFDCQERTTWVVVSPCPTGCCDRPLCLDCASRLGIEID